MTDTVSENGLYPPFAHEVTTENNAPEGTMERYPYLVQITANEDLDAKIWHWCCENFGLETFGHENKIFNPDDRWTYQDVAMSDISITAVWMFVSAEDATLFELTWC
jgi:hypothetical protein